MKLAEYEFESEHKPGKNDVNADSLSRHIASIKTEEATLTRVSDMTEIRLVVLEEQCNDAYCRGKVEEIEAQQELRFVLSTDGLLYKVDKLSEAKLFVPETLVKEVIQMHQDKVFAGHQGIKHTTYLLKLHYYWPNMNRDVEEYVK